jgi:KipI family sensor histidine kinase inhibitor
MQPKIEVAGVNSLLVRFSDQVDRSLITYIGRFCEKLKQDFADHLVDLIPSYTTVLVTYDLLKTSDAQVRDQLTSLLIDLEKEQKEGALSQVPARCITLPVCYDRIYAPDIVELSKQLQLDIDEIIQLHSAQRYQVYAVGFSPGFGYLGELDARLRVSRLATPRTQVPAGSVAIAELNTAVYPQETPGGWWLIGRCPISMFDKTREQPCLFSAGDEVIFEPISAIEYKRLQS